MVYYTEVIPKVLEIVNAGIYINVNAYRTSLLLQLWYSRRVKRK